VTYLGIDVLDGAVHNLRDPISESFGRLGTLLENPTGRRAFDDHAGIAVPVRNFTWSATTRASCNALRAFLDARLGRLVPFWVPTYRWDLQLSQDVAATSANLFLEQAGYEQFLSLYSARHYLAVYPPGGTLQIRKIIVPVATDVVVPVPGDTVSPDTFDEFPTGEDGSGGGSPPVPAVVTFTGVTEKITIDANAGSLWPAATTVISFLTLCRLADDATPIKWWRPDFAEANIRFQEIPNEVPS
jgi:hypothetical protein